MKNGLFKTQAIGTVLNDARLSKMPSGTPVLNFNVAVNETYRGKDDEIKEKTHWLKAAVYNKRAEALETHITKGTQIFLQGQISVGKPWKPEGKDMTADMILTVGNNKEDLILLGGGRRGDEIPEIQTDEDEVFTG